MNNKELFQSFAADFELTYQDDDWERLRGYFSEDAVYENLGVEAERFSGPDEILGYLKKNVGEFDRKFDSRELISLDDPQVEGDQLQRTWRVIYKKEGLPDLILEGASYYQFKDGLIQSIQAELKPEYVDVNNEWMAQYSHHLN